MAESPEATFRKILHQLAEQLWLSQLEATLESEHLKHVLSEAEKLKIKNHQDLFDVLVEKQKLAPDDLSLLSVILKQQSQSHLRPFYEAGFGHQGLENRGKQADRDGPVSIRPRTCAFIKNIKIRRACKTPAVCCETRFKDMLHRVGTNVNSEELSALKLLCQDAITRRQIESCLSGLDLMTALCKKQCITGKRPQFLYRLLQDCGRHDLTTHIDEYIYICLMRPGGSHHEAANGLEDDDHDEQAALNRLLKRDRRSQGKNYQFRRSLKKLGDNIDQSDLTSMKYVCSTCIPEGKLEKVKNVFDFFLLLEAMGKLSRSNLSYLEEVLDEKVHLIFPLYQRGFGQKKLEKMNSRDRLLHLPISTMFGTNPDMNFKRLIKTIGTRLTSDDVKELKFMCRDSTSVCIEDIESGMELLACLEKSQKISPTDIDFLAENLESIGRKDLRKYLTLYRHSTPRTSLTSSSLPVSPQPLIAMMEAEGFETTDEEYDEDTTEEAESIPIKLLVRSKTHSRSQTNTPSGSMTTLAGEQNTAAEVQQLKEQMKEKEALLQTEREKHSLELELQKSRQECEMLKKQHECEMLKNQLVMATSRLQHEQENSSLRVRLATMERANGLHHSQVKPIMKYAPFHI